MPANLFQRIDLDQEAAESELRWFFLCARGEIAGVGSVDHSVDRGRAIPGEGSNRGLKQTQEQALARYRLVAQRLERLDERTQAILTRKFSVDERVADRALEAYLECDGPRTITLKELAEVTGLAESTARHMVWSRKVEILSPRGRPVVVRLSSLKKCWPEALRRRSAKPLDKAGGS